LTSSRLSSRALQMCSRDKFATGVRGPLSSDALPATDDADANTVESLSIELASNESRSARVIDPPPDEMVSVSEAVFGSGNAFSEPWIDSPALRSSVPHGRCTWVLPAFFSSAAVIVFLRKEERTRSYGGSGLHWRIKLRCGLDLVALILPIQFNERFGSFGGSGLVRHVQRRRGLWA
jgi:hypothetical protein